MNFNTGKIEDSINMSDNCLIINNEKKLRKFDERMYTTQPRTEIDFEKICDYLKLKEVSCQKYNYNVDNKIQN